MGCLTKTIRIYVARTGEVIVTEYNEAGHTEYGVSHTNTNLCLHGWHLDRAAAIKEAQFWTRY